MKKHLCILSFSQIARDSRVLREVDLAKDHYELDVLAYGEWQPPEGVRYFRLEETWRNYLFLIKYFSLLILGKFFPCCYDRAFWLKKEYAKAVELISEINYDLIHANDWDALPVSAAGTEKLKTKILFDAHEYTPEQSIENKLIKIFIKPYKFYLLRKYSNKSQSSITVSNKIAGLYKENFGVSMETILNVPYYKKSNFTPVLKDNIQIIHHGAAVPGRHLEEMIKLVPLLDARYSFNFLLVSSSKSKYLEKIKREALKSAPGRIIFWDAIAPGEIVGFINRFDLGLPFMKVEGLNFSYALPNKFFDFIMAGLGVVIPPLPAMGEFVNNFDIGRIARSKSKEDLAELLNALELDDINNFKCNSLELAKKVNAENEMRKLGEIYTRCLEENFPSS